ncbi:glycosyl hydrolase 1 [Castilleja foliolosa]|uniref:Glycosyl hydrolase 1 n=1 Tax=Castilleja foliolosa TaxID=1961234 RepID=A0ABD3E682_9LAMI
MFPFMDSISEKLDYIGINYYGQEVVCGAGLKMVETDEYSESGRWGLSRWLGVPILGYLFWTISDNWEWADGYGPKFDWQQLTVPRISSEAHARLTICSQRL